jgi:putative restriction endonuclease
MRKPPVSVSTTQKSLAPFASHPLNFAVQGFGSSPPPTSYPRIRAAADKPRRARQGILACRAPAYDERCAISGLKIINGGGRAEVDAAHIRPVQHNGPDVVHNGIALSGTAHWMFDRGLISLSDDLDILVSRQVNDNGSVQAFINKNGRATPPTRPTDRPHPHFLSWHRENCFKN